MEIALISHFKVILFPCVNCSFFFFFFFFFFNREQADREQCLRDLKSGECKVLIATDVASRGLDVKDIT